MSDGGGAAGRDSGMDRVVDHNADWSDQVLDYIEWLVPIGWRGTGEDIRHLALDAGISLPLHSNAWGAVVMLALRRRRLLMKTGRFVPMRDPRSHARMTCEYERRDGDA